MSIKLIVGLCNPGDKYAQTRHNAGAWFVENLARRFAVSMHMEDKFFGLVGRYQQDGHDCRLLLPTTFMNNSGNAVQAVALFYKILPHEILVCHDELDLPAGTVRLKQGGGHGGHNGLRDIMPRITPDFWRLRVGIGHPGSREEVLHYVLHSPSQSDRQLIDASLEKVESDITHILSGDMQKVMNHLHR